MNQKLDLLERELDALKAATAVEAEELRIRFLGQKGLFKSLFDEFKTLDTDQKKALGGRLNTLKQAAQNRIAVLKEAFESRKEQQKSGEDFTLPGAYCEAGSRHPISLVRREIVDIFRNIGFAISDGPEVEDDYHNFSALNFPPDHPARDMQDTFFVENPEGGDPLVLRTHTSSVQVRVMEGQHPPIRTISPGRVYRNEAVSARSHCMFHQVEGLYIDKDVSFADLKATLLYFAESFFGKGTRIRLRPSYFPFTEPSAEMDVWWGLANETDRRITKGTGWLEVLGCGMVHPNVLKNCGIDPAIFSGFAFGIGLERIAMNRFQIPDIRHFFENDVRFLNQFKGL
jgi:phenylalanyl-tRNA synthetase alpha chain